MPVPQRITSWGNNAYLISGNAGCVLVDTAWPRGTGLVLAALEELGARLRLIYLTHAHVDHCGCADEIRRLTGAPIAIHGADADDLARGITAVGSARGRGKPLAALLSRFGRLGTFRPTVADLQLCDGDRLDSFGLDGEVVHTPGHTPGSTCLWVRGCDAYAGDLVATTGGPHPQSLFARDWADLASSLRRLQALNPERVFAGHGRQPLTRIRLYELRFGGLPDSIAPAR